MQTIFAIALGGAFGAVGRHYLAGAITRSFGDGFPFGIFVVNVLGSFLMGLCITLLAAKFETSPDLRAFLTVGFLGAFTTFSTFSMEVVMLFERGEWTSAVLYAGGSVLLGVVGLVLGMTMGKVFL